MTQDQIRDTELPKDVDEIAWRQASPAKVMSGSMRIEKFFDTKTIATLSVARRLEKLRRLRSVLEPRRS
jgi:hypothetical protein